MTKVADECWVALARLHRENPGREGFRPTEILRRVEVCASGLVRPGVQPHIALHNIANAKPSPAGYRMFFRLSSGEIRLFRPGDPAHPARRGKTRPDPDDLPSELRQLTVWYDTEYSVNGSRAEADPVLAMIGVGKHLWAGEDGDTFVRRLRAESASKTPSEPQAANLEPLSTEDLLWGRMLQNQGAVFHTVTGLPFSYRAEGNGIWFLRNGREVNRKLPRSHFSKAVSRLPLSKTTEISDCLDYAYLFALLTDSRIVTVPDLAA